MSNTGFLATATAVADLGSPCSIADEALLAGWESITSHQRQLDLLKTIWAAEVARRSGHELGYSGLARRKGFVNAESFLGAVTGITKAEAGKLIQVGELMAGPAAAESGELTWQGTIATAFEAGELSVDAASSISTGLAGATEPIADEHLLHATEDLVHKAGGLTVDQLLREARTERDRLDEEGIAARQKTRRDLRYFHVSRRDDGIVKGSFALDDEDGALMLELYDRAVGPRPVGPRNVGPRFVPTMESKLPTLEEPRTRGQKAADEIMGCLRIGIDADPNAVFGHNRPAVRVAVTQETLDQGVGHGRIEASPDPVTLATIERHLCTSGTIGIMFDSDGQVVNVGREQRLYTTRQRIGIALRDGGCIFPGCDRPPSWTEVHHTTPWKNGGNTNIADGISLCRLHHLLIHNNKWNVTHHHGQYWLIPPRDIDPTQNDIPMPSKQPLIRELRQSLPAMAGPTRASG